MQIGRYESLGLKYSSKILVAIHIVLMGIIIHLSKQVKVAGLAMLIANQTSQCPTQALTVQMDRI